MGVGYIVFCGEWYVSFEINCEDYLGLGWEVMRVEVE
jgi:hypothetical protein